MSKTMISESSITFRTLYDYVQQADREEFGYHFPFGRDQAGVKVFFHIYEGRMQMNLNLNDMPKAVFLFYPNEQTVRLVTVNESGVADYSSAQKLVSFDHQISDGHGGWESYFGEVGGAVKETLRDVLAGYARDLEIASKASEELSKPTCIVDVYMTLGTINKMSERINAINASYPRYVGNLVMVSDETEDEISSACDVLMSCINTVKSPGYLDCLDAGERKEVLETILVLEEKVQANLEEVRKAKEFLAKYYAH